jgi:hypothetical protein
MNRRRQKRHLYSRVTTPLSPHERRIFALLKADEATHIDEIVERLEPRTVLVRNLRDLVRTRASRKGEAGGGEEFCEMLLAVSSNRGGGLMQSFRNLKVWESADSLTLDV